MSECCNDKSCELDVLRSQQSTTLKIVLLINALMFGVELTAGLLADSISLIADSLDMLGDALVYGFSLYVVTRSNRMKAISSMIKVGIMAAFGLFVLGQAIYKILVPHIPAYETMGIIGLLALMANGICFALLWHHRTDDINMTSVWVCSRNDIIANISVLFAAFGVWLTSSGLPDVIVGLALAVLFLRSAFHVFRQAISEMKTNQQPASIDIKSIK